VLVFVKFNKILVMIFLVSNKCHERDANRDKSLGVPYMEQRKTHTHLFTKPWGSGATPIPPII